MFEFPFWCPFPHETLPVFLCEISYWYTFHTDNILGDFMDHQSVPSWDLSMYDPWDIFLGYNTGSPIGILAVPNLVSIILDEKNN